MCHYRLFRANYTKNGKEQQALKNIKSQHFCNQSRIDRLTNKRSDMHYSDFEVLLYTLLKLVKTFHVRAALYQNKENILKMKKCFEMKRKREITFKSHY